jgi:sugar phosphate isomerase/epimerase
VGRFFYNTNGFAFHRLEDAVEVLAELGYDGVALTPDVHHLDPLSASDQDVDTFRRLLERRGLGVVIETGARFVLDPRHKHRPSLLDPPALAARRLEFLTRSVDLAARLGAPVVTVWSGNGPADLPAEEALSRLASGLRSLCRHARGQGVRIAFEPEPGMAVETAAAWVGVRDLVEDETLGLTLDVGHCLATGEGAPDAVLRAHAADLLVLQLDDHVPGVHEHLAFGEGQVDFPAIARAVEETGFSGPLEVELSRHSATAPTTAEASLHFLRRVFGNPNGAGPP